MLRSMLQQGFEVVIYIQKENLVIRVASQCSVKKVFGLDDIAEMVVCAPNFKKNRPNVLRIKIDILVFIVDNQNLDVILFKSFGV